MYVCSMCVWVCTLPVYVKLLEGFRVQSKFKAGNKLKNKYKLLFFIIHIVP